MEPRQPFPCKLRKPSPQIPTSVHKLRPGDIQVVAALGDSVTAGVGARANSVLDIFKEYRGVSFSVGGEKTWREYITLPNILELFNPNLYGQSYGITRFIDIKVFETMIVSISELARGRHLDTISLCLARQV